jgi:cytoskeleton protein RodZ
MRRFAEQAARRVVYIVITAAIAVPVWLATRPHLGTMAHDAAPLDVPAVGEAAPASPLPQSPRPLVASIASLPAAPGDGDAPLLGLRLRGDSWVEVTGHDGQVIEQGLLRAGTQRAWPAEDVAGIVLGDAAAVEVLRDGQPQDIAGFQRANVARFTVSSDGSLAPAAD